MRKDFSKVLVEEPRYESHAKNFEAHKLRRSDRDNGFEVYDDLSEESFHPAMSMRPKSKYFLDRKVDNKGEHLGPLRAFLYKAAVKRRSWDKVYSELKAANPPGTPVGDHIFLHIWDYVHKDVRLDKDGRIYSFRIIYSCGARNYLEKGEIYIHPKTKTLRLVK